MDTKMDTKLEKTFSVTELIKQEWFPIKSYQTVMNYIKSGKLKAIDTNSQQKKKIKRLVIRYSDAIKFILDNNG